MKKIILFSMILLFSCCKEKESTKEAVEILKTNDTVQVTKTAQSDIAISKEYANKRFREVTVQKLDDDTYRVKGQGQIFESSFSWIVEDGHYELAKGFEMTDAGAPEWGRFDFTLKVSKKNQNSTLTLILFEISAKDGSRQYELPIPLPY
ncbi:MAG: sporulation protein [Flavobacteriia bacterium]|nr:sporulation protein [Flavobacteriia bacterium]NCT17906.1 sporulation protein [Flavobacteriia bacterium]